MIYTGIDKWNSPPLKHHGVKGMKWGVRKDRTSSSGRYPVKFKALSSKAKSAGKTALKVMSDADRYSRLYKRAVKMGRFVATSPQMQQYGLMAIAGISAHPAVGIGVAALAGSAVLGYGVYSIMRHDDFQDDEYLAHYGVKGMKWGVRKVRDMVSNMRRRSAERRAIRDERREQLRVQRNAEAIASGDSRKIIRRMPKMTNEEIQSAINRLNMQKSVYQLNDQLNEYKAQEQSNSFFGRLMADRKQPQTNQNFNNNKDKGVIGRAIDKQIESVVNNAAEAAVTSAISGNNFSDTFRKKYGYKTTAEKIQERKEKRLSNARDTMNIMAINSEIYKNTSSDLKSSKVLRKKLKTGRDLYDTDLSTLIENVDINSVNKINWKAGEKKK